MCGKQSETPLYGKGLFCSKSCQAKFAFKKASQARTKKCSEKKLEKEQKLLEEKRTTRCICEKCKKEYFLIDGFSKRFCSSSCAHFRVFTVHKVMTAEAKQKISAGLKKYFSENRLAGSKANVNRPKRQLPEIAIEHTRQAALKKDKSYITDPADWLIRWFDRLIGHKPAYNGYTHPIPAQKLAHDDKLCVSQIAIPPIAARPPQHHCRNRTTNLAIISGNYFVDVVLDPHPAEESV
jgi:hypothetical protein